jgi:hypothetical protein
VLIEDAKIVQPQTAKDAILTTLENVTTAIPDTLLKEILVSPPVIVDSTDTMLLKEEKSVDLVVISA